MSYDSCKDISWFSLLDGAGKFELLDLITVIESYLIDKLFLQSTSMLNPQPL